MGLIIISKQLIFLKKYSIILLGTSLIAIGLDAFLIPSNLAAGGVSGLSTVLSHLTKLPVGLLVLVINVPIFFMAFLNFDRRLVFDSAVATGFLSFFISLFSGIDLGLEDSFLCSVFGGLVSGIGMGLVFLSGATSGGTDIIAKLLQKKFPGISIGRLLLFADIFVIAFAMFVFKDVYVGLYSIVSFYTNGRVVDAVLEGSNFSKIAFIISDNHKQIASRIINEVSRGVTGLRGVGMYSGSERIVMMCVVRRSEIKAVSEIVKSEDSSAFMFLADTREVFGEGFGYM